MTALSITCGILVALVSAGLGLWAGQYAHSHYRGNSAMTPSHYRSFGFWFTSGSSVTLAGSLVLMADPVSAIAPIIGGTCLMLAAFGWHYRNHKRAYTYATSLTPVCV